MVDGRPYVSPTFTTQLAHRFVGAGSAQDLTPAGRLSGREFEVFRLLGSGLETRRIARDLHLGIKTVQAHCASIKDKLGLANATELIREAVRWVEREKAPRT